MFLSIGERFSERSSAQGPAWLNRELTSVFPILPIKGRVSSENRSRQFLHVNQIYLRKHWLDPLTYDANRCQNSPKSDFRHRITFFVFGSPFSQELSKVNVVFGTILIIVFRHFEQIALGSENHLENTKAPELSLCG